jgi:hypothetical protein
VRVVLLLLQAVHPGSLLDAVAMQGRFGLLSQIEVKGRVSPPYRLGLAALLQALGSVGADRLQHRKARLALGMYVLEQALVDPGMPLGFEFYSPIHSPILGDDRSYR